MRLWSLHPRYLDAKGLVALWREALLAQKVLKGETRGYRKHPQLERFRAHPAPEGAIGSYLRAVWEEAERRSYQFDRARIAVNGPSSRPVPVNDGQLRFELAHLAAKLKARDPAAHARLQELDVPDPHPSFVVIPGPVAAWERSGGRPAR